MINDADKGVLIESSNLSSSFGLSKVTAAESKFRIGWKNAVDLKLRFLINIKDDTLETYL